MNAVAESCSRLCVDLLIANLLFVLCVSESSANVNEQRKGLFLCGVETSKSKCSQHAHYSGFGAGFSETKTTFEAAVDVKHNGKSRWARCYGRRRSATSCREIRCHGS